MRELKVIGLDVDGRHIICEGPDPADRFTLQVDDRLRAAVRGDRALGQTLRDIEVKGVLRPRDIQARIRAGASVEQLAESSGMDITKVERFAHPVLLERARAAELASAAHPILADGPAVTVAARNDHHRPDGPRPQSRRDGVGRLARRRRPLGRADGLAGGLSDNVAHFRFARVRTAARSPPSTTPPAN